MIQAFRKSHYRNDPFIRRLKKNDKVEPVSDPVYNEQSTIVLKLHRQSLHVFRLVLAWGKFSYQLSLSVSFIVFLS